MLHKRIKIKRGGLHPLISAAVVFRLRGNNDSIHPINISWHSAPNLNDQTVFARSRKHRVWKASEQLGRDTVEALLFVKISSYVYRGIKSPNAVKWI